ncbi:hypothetical protein NPIL_356991 [Nephila pilipes]|uniref:Uncharacterized protein n=1 Tax=Nephila pilipes TaxID=299642 RepID=A0A8X6PJK7_NEPPI|nr:hypothetical protein NPIL_356991 [Nephila pilipes]
MGRVADDAEEWESANIPHQKRGMPLNSALTPQLRKNEMRDTDWRQNNSRVTGVASAAYGIQTEFPNYGDSCCGMATMRSLNGHFGPFYRLVQPDPSVDMFLSLSRWRLRVR